MIGTEVAAVFLKRRVQPIMARAHPMWLYSGPKDDTRINIVELSEKELLDEVRRLTLFSQEDSIPLISSHPPFDANHPPMEIPMAPESFRDLPDDASEGRDSSAPFIELFVQFVPDRHCRSFPAALPCSRHCRFVVSGTAARLYLPPHAQHYNAIKPLAPPITTFASPAPNATRPQSCSSSVAAPPHSPPPRSAPRSIPLTTTSRRRPWLPWPHAFAQATPKPPRAASTRPSQAAARTEPSQAAASSPRTHRLPRSSSPDHLRSPRCGPGPRSSSSARPATARPPLAVSLHARPSQAAPGHSRAHATSSTSRSCPVPTGTAGRIPAALPPTPPSIAGHPTAALAGHIHPLFQFRSILTHIFAPNFDNFPASV
nr:extensin-like [Lolium perenne]